MRIIAIDHEQRNANTKPSTKPNPFDHSLLYAVTLIFIRNEIDYLRRNLCAVINSDTIAFAHSILARHGYGFLN